MRWRVRFQLNHNTNYREVTIAVDAASNYLALAKAGIELAHQFGVSSKSVKDVWVSPEPNHWSMV